VLNKFNTGGENTRGMGRAVEIYTDNRWGEEREREN
jgi:hypothetical protein